jgi:hypothetical protein
LNHIGAHSPIARVRGRIRMGLGIKSGLRRWIRNPRHHRSPGPLGESSHFAEGDWVRVRDETSVRQTLDAHSRLRGLKFTPVMWATCGKGYQVQAVVRRICDDAGRLRPVSETVLLRGFDCGGEDGSEGCGRFCPMMYRDEWLEPAAAPAQEEPVPKAAAMPRGPEPALSGADIRGDKGPEDARYARIRAPEAIAETLNLLGLRDGLMFMPQMARHAGQRVRVLHEVSRVYEYDRSLRTTRPFYILEDLRCSGAAQGDDGPCDRACWMIWHEDWLELDV